MQGSKVNTLTRKWLKRKYGTIDYCSIQKSAVTFANLLVHARYRAFKHVLSI